MKQRPDFGKGGFIDQLIFAYSASVMGWESMWRNLNTIHYERFVK